MASLPDYLSLLADTAVAVDRNGFRVGVRSAGARLGRGVREGGCALGCRVDGA
jgi:hypothetical protein